MITAGRKHACSLGLKDSKELGKPAGSNSSGEQRSRPGLGVWRVVRETNISAAQGSFTRRVEVYWKEVSLVCKPRGLPGQERRPD